MTNITTREVSHVTIVDIRGRITLGDETGNLRDTVRKLIADGKKKIVLNLAHVDYIDSSGVGELVSSFTAVRNSGGELKLLSLTRKSKTSSTSPSSTPSSISKKTNSPP